MQGNVNPVTHHLLWKLSVAMITSGESTSIRHTKGDADIGAGCFRAQATLETGMPFVPGAENLRWDVVFTGDGRPVSVGIIEKIILDQFLDGAGYAYIIKYEAMRTHIQELFQVNL